MVLIWAVYSLSVLFRIEEDCVTPSLNFHVLLVQPTEDVVSVDELTQAEPFQYCPEMQSVVLVALQ